MKYMRFWKVKFTDWLWFVFYLRCDEFSQKLTIAYYPFSMAGYNKMISDRARAHRVDFALSEGRERRP